MPPRSLDSAHRRSSIATLLAAGLLMAGCVFMPSEQHYSEDIVAQDGPNPDAPRLAALETSRFDAVAGNEEVLGDLQVLFSRYENTLVRIARKHNVGLDELQLANPGVDIWLPGEATPIYLPTMSILPTTPRAGIVLNLPAMRLFYFDESTDGMSVTTHPVGIGREGWATPTGQTTVTDKVVAPAWYPPASVRAEHEALGDPLPSVVPPGPDNPLGDYALDLEMPGYLIHGTNKPAGVGMRVSHGCIRLYPEDIEALFDRVPSSAPVARISCSTQRRSPRLLVRSSAYPFRSAATHRRQDATFKLRESSRTMCLSVPTSCRPIRSPLPIRRLDSEKRSFVRSG
jgi:lipoprotein-anchoring transpeptidase ErfK/SrfK